MTFKSFEDLQIRKDSIGLVKQIYVITSKWKFDKDFWLRDQIRRSTISISSNIVEWFERSNNNEFVRFLKISKWSCGEARNQLYIAFVLWYIDQKEFDSLKELFISLSSQIWGFLKYLQWEKIKWNFTKK